MIVASLIVTLFSLGILVGKTTALAYEVVQVSDGGTITGKVAFEGKPPAPERFKVEKNPEVCGEVDRLLQEVAANNGTLADVVVVLEGVEKGKPYTTFTIEGPPPGSREMKRSEGEGKELPATEIRPKSCIFGAFTGVVANGRLVRFFNQDPVKHSPHTYEIAGMVRASMFNMDLEGNGKLEAAVEFKKKKSVAMKLECDQHSHMQNFFYKVDNPYYAFSAQDGSFKMEQVPPGKYRLIAWHPKFREKEMQEVTVKPNGAVEVSFKFTWEK